MPISITIAGVIELVLTQVLGPVVTSGEVESFIKVAGLLLGLILTWYGRWSHGDITWYGRKY
jgi:hypothetical protein